MSKEEKSVLATACSVQNFAAGDVILREGEVGEWMFIVIEGTVKTVDQLLGSTKGLHSPCCAGCPLITPSSCERCAKHRPTHFPRK